jgi:hypothetical protein
LVTPETAAQIRATAQNANHGALLTAVALSAAVQWLRAWRFAVMTNGTAALPDAKLVGIAFQLNFFNFALPFRLGELSYPVLMRRAYGQPVVSAAAVLIGARLLDLCSVSALLLVIAAWLGLPSAGSAPLIGAAGVALGAAPFFLPALRLPAGGRSRIAKLVAGSPALGNRSAGLFAVALSFGVWLAFGALAILAAEAVRPGFPPAVAMLGAAASNLAFALPVNGIAGLGPAQAAWVFVVTEAGVAWDNAVVSAFAVYVVTLVSALLFGGLAMLGSAALPGQRASTTRPSGLDKPIA